MALYIYIVFLYLRVCACVCACVRARLPGRELLLSKALFAFCFLTFIIYDQAVSFIHFFVFFLLSKIFQILTFKYIFNAMWLVPKI